MKTKQTPCHKLVTHKWTLRVANCHGIFVMIVGNIVRFAHFGSRGDKAFPFAVTTIFVMPPMITMFILSEFRVKLPEFRQ